MPTFTSEELTYYYEERGTGPAVLLLHGFTGSSDNWQALQRALAAEFRAIAVDLPICWAIRWAVGWPFTWR